MSSNADGGAYSGCRCATARKSFFLLGVETRNNPQYWLPSHQCSDEIDDASSRRDDEEEEELATAVMLSYDFAKKSSNLMKKNSFSTMSGVDSLQDSSINLATHHIRSVVN